MVRSAGTNLYVVPSRTMLTSWVAPVAAGAGAGAAAVVVSAAGVSAFFSPPHPANTTDSPATTTGFIIAFQPPSLVEWVVSPRRQRAFLEIIRLVNKFTK